MWSNRAGKGVVNNIFKRISILVVLCVLFLYPLVAEAARIKVVPSVTRVNPGESFSVDIVVEGIPSPGLGAVQFRLNMDAEGTPVTSVPDILQGKATGISVASPLLVGPPTQTRSGMGGFFLDGMGQHGILVMDNDVLDHGSGMYTFAHTNGSSPPAGDGTVAVFRVLVGSEVTARKITITLTDVMLLDTGEVYPLEGNTGAVVDLGCLAVVPDITGLAGSDARTALEGANLAAGSVYELDNRSGQYELGRVLEQSVSPGTSVECGTTVDFAVNTAPSDVGTLVALDKAGDESGAVVLSWVPSVSADTAGYRVYRLSAPAGLLVEINDPASRGTELSGLPNGEAVQLRVTAFDRYWNESTGVTVMAVAADDVSPVINISGIVDGAFYAVDVMPSVDVSDSGPVSVTMTLNDSPYDGALITAEGRHTLVVSATDTAGNTASREISFVIDKTPPEITVTGVEKDTYYNTDLSPLVSVADENLGESSILLNGAAYVSGTVISEEGVYRLEVTATDRAGNGSSDTYVFYIDKTSPASFLSVGEPRHEFNSVLFVTDASIFSLTGSDEGVVSSGIERFEYRTGGGEWTTVASQFTLAGLNDGPVVVDYRAVDRAGNIEAHHSISVVMDTAPPTTTLTISGSSHVDSGGTTYAAEGAVIVLEASDAGSGVAETLYRIDGGAWTPYSVPFSISGEGSHTVEYRSTDNLGNVEGLKSMTIIIDGTPPATVIEVGSPMHDSGTALFVKGGTLFTLSAADNLSGVAKTEYRIDGGAWILYAPFSLTAEGSHLIEYRSTDNVGNVEQPQSLTVIVDNTPPVTSIEVGTPKYEDGTVLYVSSATVFALSATDTLSGAGSTEYRIDGGQWTEYAPFRITTEGSHSIMYRSTDNVGNVEIEKILTVIVDDSPPLTTITTGSPHYQVQDVLYVTSSTVFSITAEDEGSGVAIIEYMIDNASWQTYDMPFTLAGEGSHEIAYRAKDKLGNIESTKTFQAIVDNTPPVTDISVGSPKYGAQSGKLFVTKDTVFTLAGTDNISGVKATEYRIDGGAWTAYAPFAIQPEGAHIIEYRSIDNVDNVEAVKSLEVVVDNTPPVTEISLAGPKHESVNGDLFVTRSTTFTLTAGDNLSGVASTEYSIDGGVWTPYVPFTINGEGKHTIKYRSTDNVSNTETEKILTVIIDNTAPETTIDVGQPKHDDGTTLYARGDTEFTLSAVDSLSGVKTMEYRIDGGAWRNYAPFTVPSEGNHTIGYRSTDNVGNIETEKYLAVVIDNTPPRTEISASDGLLEEGVVNAVSPETRFTLEATDDLSGVREIQYRIDGGPWKTYLNSFTLYGLEAGEHAIAYRSTDNVENEEGENIITVRLIVLDVSKEVSTDAVVLAGAWWHPGDDEGDHEHDRREPGCGEESDGESRGKEVSGRHGEREKGEGKDGRCRMEDEDDEKGFRKTQRAVDTLAAILESSGIDYYIPESGEDFRESLRSGRFNTYVLVDFGEEYLEEELREAVHYGDGLVFIKTRPGEDDDIEEVFGVRFRGTVHGRDHEVYLTDSPVSFAGTLHAGGRAVRAEVASDSAEVFGYLEDRHGEHPAVIYNEYGRGKTVLFTFDLLNSDDQYKVEELLLGAIEHVKPAEHYIRAFGSVPVKITVRNSTGAVELEVTETLPYGVGADTFRPGAAGVTDDSVTWRKTLQANEKALFRYHLNLPDAAGEYVTVTEVRYAGNGGYRLYGTYELAVSVTADSAGLLESIFSDLQVMAETLGTLVLPREDDDEHHHGHEGEEHERDGDHDDENEWLEKVEEAAAHLEKVDVTAADRKGAEKNIRRIIKAIDEIMKLPLDTFETRLKLDELMKIWQMKWYALGRGNEKGKDDGHHRDDRYQ